MKKTIATVGLGLIMAAGMLQLAEAANWKELGGDDKSLLSIDFDSIKITGSLREVWTMWNFKEARPNQGDEGFPALKSYKDMYHVDCKAGTMRLSREIIYAENDAQGDLRDHSQALRNSTFNKPTPMSVGAALLQTVCDYSPGGAKDDAKADSKADAK